MQAFPQLMTSATVQYPFRTVTHARSITNRTGDERLVQATDPDHTVLRWELQFIGLERTECENLERLFEACEGSLRNFTFLDPSSNLLASSDDLLSPIWVKDPLLQVTAGKNDPWGVQTASELANVSAADQEIGQTLAVPADFHYVFSVYGRSSAPGTLRLSMTGGGQPLMKSFAAGSQWARMTLGGNLGEAGDAVRFAVQLSPGAAIAIAGAQVESGLSPTEYKRTIGAGGVFPFTYFDQDELEVEATVPNGYSCIVRLASRAG